jgi:hypothetical protein
MPSNAERPVEPHTAMPHEEFGPHPRADQPPEQRQDQKQDGGAQRQESRGGDFAPHPRTGNERLVQGHPHAEQDQHRDDYGHRHQHFQHFGERGYYQDGEWYADDSYAAYQDETPDDGTLPPVATDNPVAGSCYVTIPQDQVLDVQDMPSGNTVVSSLENGADVIVVEQQQTWIKIAIDQNPLGWVLQDYVACD